MAKARRILIVDDDPDIVTYLTSVLEDHGYQTSSSADGEGALEALEASIPDGILLDVMMPGRSGLDLLVRIRLDGRWGTIPILVLTGHDAVLEDRGETYLRSHGVERGADAVLGKPVNLGELLGTLGSLVPLPSPA